MYHFAKIWSINGINGDNTIRGEIYEFLNRLSTGYKPFVFAN